MRCTYFIGCCDCKASACDIEPWNPLRFFESLTKEKRRYSTNELPHALVNVDDVLVLLME